MIASFLLTFTLIGILIGLVYTFLIWNFNCWKKKGVPGPKPQPLFGNFPNMVTQKENIVKDIQKVYNQYRDDEDFVGVFSMRTPHLIVINPELVHRVLVTDFNKFHDNEAASWFDSKKDIVMSNNAFMLYGDEWKERRKEIVPGLTANRIKAVYPVTQEICKKLTQFIKERPKDVDAKDLSLRYTSDVVTDCALGIKADCLSDNPTPVLKWTKTLFQQTSSYLAFAFAASLWPTLKSIYLMKWLKQDTEKFFIELISNAMELRCKTSSDRVDFLNYMLQLQEKKQLSNNDVFSHSMTFLLDGFETTASVITHCLYQLAKYPDCQEKLRKEVESSLNENGEIDFDTLDNLPYIDQCIHESIRIIPPLLFGTKLCTQPCEFVNKNSNRLQLKYHENVIIPFYALHHDEQYYPQPSEFIPERFNPENGGVKKFRDMGVFLGFSDGPRICLGMKFALIQTKAALAEIVRNFNVKLNSKTRTDNRLNPTDFLGALDGGVWLDFEKRN
ncbi:probable cytochrome P450 28d1 [Episyrphus balteatus]|uniref:probable cytochrome P450 28d1 n=1 Tax=Episyrphus balteatus TaxID=286459 RepID=UPI00248684CE|nr:probable cytochrome P450 28d1 [Episyrphus balteatus]